MNGHSAEGIAATQNEWPDFTQANADYTQAQYEFSVEQAIATIRESARFMGQTDEEVESVILRVRALCNVN